MVTSSPKSWSLCLPHHVSSHSQRGGEGEIGGRERESEGRVKRIDEMMEGLRKGWMERKQEKKEERKMDVSKTKKI